ncbi:MAG: C_GCAxxG_C_C family protein [Ruminococcaceae bacterium]|nr:C_GCAxxG_C_C family protein [Oscillospiraceae bacterium]
MNNKQNQAMEYHAQGYNCAQAVALPFCEEMGLEPTVVKRATEGFGAGMGGRTQTCGALSGAVFVAGMLKADAVNPGSKMDTYKVCAKMSERFVSECGSGVCAVIKGLTGGKMLCSCNDCIACGVRLVEEFIRNNAK